MSVRLPVCQSSGCFCSSRHSLCVWTCTRLRRCKVLVDLCVGSSYRFRLLWSTGLPAGLDVGLRRFGRYQRSLLAGHQVLYLDRQVHEARDAMVSVFFVLVQYVLVLQLVRVLANVLTACE